MAARAFDVGALVGDGDIKWQSWPKPQIADGVIRESAVPNAVGELKGSVGRGQFFAGEPIRPRETGQGADVRPHVGWSAERPSRGRDQYRIRAAPSPAASSFPTTTSTSCAPFVTRRPSSRRVRTSIGGRPILPNVRVLAIGPNVQRERQSVVPGSTATLELAPHQTGNLVLAQRTGHCRSRCGA